MEEKFVSTSYRSCVQEDEPPTRSFQRSNGKTMNVIVIITIHPSFLPFFLPGMYTGDCCTEDSKLFMCEQHAMRDLPGNSMCLWHDEQPVDARVMQAGTLSFHYLVLYTLANIERPGFSFAVAGVSTSRGRGPVHVCLLATT